MKELKTTKLLDTTELLRRLILGQAIKEGRTIYNPNYEGPAPKDLVPEEKDDDLSREARAAADD